MSWTTLYSRAYTPYSHKQNACIVESKSGKYYAGVRVENISFPITIPSAQAACAICLSESERPSKIYVQNSNLDQLHFWSTEFDLEIIETETSPVDRVENLHRTLDTDFTPLSKLKSLLNQAVTPNSDFPVSALLFTESGYFEGANVEVSDWTKGICAERVAIAKAIAAGITEFDRMEIHTRKGEVSSPCGTCRQVIAELLPYHDIKLHHSDGTLSEHLSVDLLPFSFKSSDLKK